MKETMSLEVKHGGKVNLKELADSYYKEHNIPLIEGVAGDRHEGFEVVYTEKNNLEKLKLTRFYDSENILDYEYACASRKKNGISTIVTYVSLDYARIHKKFKDVPQNMERGAYRLFLKEINEAIEQNKEKCIKDGGISLKYETEAFQLELKKILDELVRKI